MVLDYSERKQVNRNRPRRQFPWAILLTNVLILVVGYAAGMATGWFVFHQPPAPPAAVQKTVLAPAPQPASPAVPPADTPLTFYETLPKGSKQVVLGTGINQPKADQPPKQASQAGDVTQPHPDKLTDKALTPASPVSATAVSAKAVPAPAKSESDKTSFAVQIASCKTRDEAEAMKAKYQGAQAYVVESTVAGKGTWYRVRAGRKMDRRHADELAAKIGGQAIVIAE